MTASFLRELLRRSALIAADASTGGPLAVTAAQLDAALDELLDTRNAMRRVLLGAPTRPIRNRPGGRYYTTRSGPPMRYRHASYDD